MKLNQKIINCSSSHIPYHHTSKALVYQWLTVERAKSHRLSLRSSTHDCSVRVETGGGGGERGRRRKRKEGGGEKFKSTSTYGYNKH
jgi:hypothetical protein